MIAGYLIQIVQVIGILIPVVGIIVLLQKEQNKATMHLMITNIGCLIMNGSYLLMLRSQTYEEAMLAFKMEYLGNVIFYIFFSLFVMSYFGKKCPKWIFYGWLFYECCNVFVLWSDSKRNFWFDKIAYEVNTDWNLHFMKIDLGVLYIVRYCFISMVLCSVLAYTMFRMFRTKVKPERESLGRLAGTEFVILLSLVMTILGDLSVDIVPIAASLSILAIIQSVIEGDFFGITSMGRAWAFEQMPDAVIIVDSVYRYLDSNEFARRIFPELKIQPKGWKVSEKVYHTFMAETCCQEIDGRYYEKKVMELRQEDKIDGYSLLLVDITEHQQLMEQLKVEKERADEANQAKSAFMSNMSHEIRTPMNAIVGMTEILMRRDLPAQEMEYLQNIKSSGNALLTIVNDILDFSKIESGKLEIIEDNYEPMSLLSDLSMIFLNRIGEKDVELFFDIDKDVPIMLYGDELRLRQIIINIVNNAIKFTDEGSVTLTVRVEKVEADDIALLFSVKDTGQGIAKDDIEVLFDSFQQVDTKKNRYKEGTGLGLAISKQLVEMMGGTIQVRSEYGVGSEFYFTIHQKVVEARKAAEIKRADTVIVSGRMKDERNLEILKKLADLYGVEFIDCGDMSEGKLCPEFFFVDDVDFFREMSKEQKMPAAMELCLLQNPMKDNTWNSKITVVNKPLYSLNFCQTINREHHEHTLKEENVMNFIAPDARILVVDDNEMNRKVAMGLLEPLQMHIHTAENGKQALEKIRCNKYDLIFMDHMMPIMDGIEAVERLRQMDDPYYKQVPVIALTANAVVEAREKFAKAGMNDFVAKPIKVKEICSKIRKWLPEEYIQEVEKESESAVEVEILPEIEGLNVAEGIANSGSKELFLQLLGDFYKLIDMKSVKMEKCLADGLIRDYTIEVHALKNTARMIGAMELSAQCYYLEQCGNAENISVLEQDTPKMLELYRSYKDILRPYAMQQAGEKKEVTDEERIRVLDNLRTAMDNFDLDAADEAMQQLEEYQFPSGCEQMLDELRAYVADVAMEEVIELAGKLIRQLRESQEDKAGA